MMADDGQDEEAASAHLPGMLIDGSYILWWDGHMRICFYERVSGKKQWRSAIIMETGAVRRLIDNLENVLTKMEARKEKNEDAEKEKGTQPDTED